MLQIREISKRYITGDLEQIALCGVSLNLRDNEFVAILGASGSGKTTLLNIIGGLDRYDSGDLIINGISTKKYKDRDWDSYRNHTVGFVFQSYNLIPHQSVLANVELALTISGISKTERRKRAKVALEQVGLGNQYHKKPNQMSGGQMQRVAIARALVNNPEILLADEPTGALDTETSVQVMELLKEVAKDRLVVMVTHNPELAAEYATRIVKVRDGEVCDDSNPFEPKEEQLESPIHRNMGRASMSFLTALSLSFDNLKTKKGRTILTAFAGSIGIIGIALILSISNGVSTYITDIQKDTMTSYPILIQKQTIDLNALMEYGMNMTNEEVLHDRDGVYSDGTALEIYSGMSTSVTENNLTAFKRYLDNPESSIHSYIGETGIVYTYDIPFNLFTYDPEDVFINTDGSMLESHKDMSGVGASDMSSLAGAGLLSNIGGMSEMGEMFGMSSGILAELLPASDEDWIHRMIRENYEIVYGEWPKEYDEMVLVLDENNALPTHVLYQLGFLPVSEYLELMKKIEQGQEVTLESRRFSYEEICSKVYYLVPGTDMYVQQESALELKIVGIVRPQTGTKNRLISAAVGYTRGLTDYLMDYMKGSKDAPASISIYVDSFEAKEGITACIEEYNRTAKDADKISYTDYVGLILSSVTTIISVISYVLIAFVGVSLVVSSIMIGIITYISVLERTKEIGILRAIGASKHNISQVFSAETFMIGLGSGFIGVGITVLLLIPANALIHAITKADGVNASLPFGAAVILILLSVVLTLIGGIIPSKKAALKDPVTALRTE